MRSIEVVTDKKKKANDIYRFPWKYDGPCMNFQVPDETLTPEEATAASDHLDVRTIVTSDDLSDYSFISRFKNLEQLYIYKGKNITDISFIGDLVFLSQIVIVSSNVESLEPLQKLIEKKKNTLIPYGIEGICIQSDNDLAMDKPHGIHIGELIINWRRI
ncbi:MAG: hypothetical protein IKE53_02505 [Clostridiales bacterium]|nr:hypothetical protein [Clostridiales bacterium]